MKLYGLYDIERRKYYEEDNRDDSQAERLLIAGADLEEIRQLANEHYAKEEVIRSHRGHHLVIPPWDMKSNNWYNSGGGCMAAGHIEIRELPTSFEK